MPTISPHTRRSCSPVSFGGRPGTGRARNASCPPSRYSPATHTPCPAASPCGYPPVPAEPAGRPDPDTSPTRTHLNPKPTPSRVPEDPGDPDHHVGHPRMAHPHAKSTGRTRTLPSKITPLTADLRRRAQILSAWEIVLMSDGSAFAVQPHSLVAFLRLVGARVADLLDASIDVACPHH
jgi:hypothetical protein